MPILTVAIEGAALIVAGTMVGNEFAVAAFVHPDLSHLDDRTHARSAQALARTFGRVMPVWYAATLVLNIAVVFMARTPWGVPWWLACASAVLFAISIGYTILGLVPINNRVSTWDLDALPSDWREQRRRWDRLHEIRVVLLFAALVSLTLSTVLEHAA